MNGRFDKEAAILEAIFFLDSEPLDLPSLARVSGLDEGVVEEALDVLRTKLAEEHRGLELCRMSGGYALVPKRDLWERLRDRYGRKNDGRMSKAALETLSIIAYSQPITRAEIEAIRGVSADGMMRFLSEKGLVKEVGKKDAPGKPVQYGTTKEFLRYFRLDSIADLPRLDELERERYETESREAETPADAPDPDKSSAEGGRQEP